MDEEMKREVYFYTRTADENNCNHCVHGAVCQYANKFLDLSHKLNLEAVRLFQHEGDKDIFRVDASCKYYYHDDSLGYYHGLPIERDRTYAESV